MACALAGERKARLIVAHVLPPPLVHGELVARRQTNGYHEEMNRALQRIQAPNVTVEHRLVEGKTAEEIVRLAQECQADLIVMGTHGRTGAVRLLMGSVAEQVLRKASCPVLMVKGPVRP